MRTLLALGSLLVAACGGPQIRTHYDPAINPRVPAFRTYAWLDAPAEQPELSPAPLGEEIRRITDDVLAIRNYRLADTAPDFRVGWHLTGDEPVTVSTLNMRYGYTWGRWFPGGGVVFSGRYRPEVPSHTLVLDLVDGSYGELIWRGQAQLAPRNLRDPRQRDEMLTEAIRRMLERFPP